MDFRARWRGAVLTPQKLVEELQEILEKTLKNYKK